MRMTQSLNPILFAAITVGTTGFAFSTAAQAGASASVGVANLYLFRGQNLSNSAPQVYGSLDYEHESGPYAGIWGSSEGAAGGQEYDVYVGFKGEVNDFFFDVNFTAYEYPSNTATGGSGQNSANDFGDFSEFILKFGTMGFSFTLVDSLQGENSSDPDSKDAGYNYYALSYDTDVFGATVGHHNFPGTPDDTNMTHLDLNYYATDELTFTLSQVVDQDPDKRDEAAFNDDLLFVVNWSKSFDL
ncbi:MAG: TorF family putative porin [Gammaproteobacteria bacterium]